MGKDFKKKVQRNPTRRKLVDMVKTGTNMRQIKLLVGIAKKEDRKVGDVWEDEHYRYEKKEGYTLKEGKNSDLHFKK